MKYLVPVFAVLLMTSALRAQTPAQPVAPKGKFVMTAASLPVSARSSPTRHASGNRHSRQFFYQPTSICLTNSPANPIGDDAASSSRQSVAPPATELSVDSVQSWEPSTYMDYDAALALGKQMQSTAAQPNVTSISLGEVARSVRAAKAQADAPKPLS